MRAELQLNCERFLSSIASVNGAIEGLHHHIGLILGKFEGLKLLAEGVAEAFEKTVSGTLEMGAQLTDLSANTGQSVHDLVILQQAFQNAGLGADAVGPMLAKFQKALSGVNEEGQPTNDALQRLRLNVDGFREMPAIEQFKELQRAFERIQNPVERTQLAMELFGKSGAKMLAMLSEGGGLGEAAAQVGGFADLMEANAKVFHNVEIAIRPPHSPAPVPVLTVSGAAGAKANS